MRKVFQPEGVFSKFTDIEFYSNKGVNVLAKDINKSIIPFNHNKEPTLSFWEKVKDFFINGEHKKAQLLCHAIVVANGRTDACELFKSIKSVAVPQHKGAFVKTTAL